MTATLDTPTHSPCGSGPNPNPPTSTHTYTRVTIPGAGSYDRLQFETLSALQPGPGEVVIDVRAVASSRRDPRPTDSASTWCAWTTSSVRTAWRN